MRAGHVATAKFAAIAHAVAGAQGQPDHPIFVLPATTNCMSAEELHAQADDVLLALFNLPKE